MKSRTFYCSSEAVSFINEKVPPIFTLHQYRVRQNGLQSFEELEEKSRAVLIFWINQYYTILSSSYLKNNAHKVEAVSINILLKTSSTVLNDYITNIHHFFKNPIS